mgnify:CR=1 FL=1
MDQSLVMTFKTDLGKETTYTLSGVKDNLTENEISAFMDYLISSNCIVTSAGSFQTKVKASIVQKVSTSYTF